MKRVIPACLLLLSACVSTPSDRDPDRPRTETPEEIRTKEIVRGYFEAWRKAVVDQDASRVLARISSQMASDWLYHRMLEKGDATFQKLLAVLPGDSKVELDFWFAKNKEIRPDFSNGRPSILPVEILSSEWLKRAWETYYRAEAGQQAVWAGRMEIVEVYPEGGAATVLVRVEGATKMYEMIVEGAEWRLHYSVRRPTGSGEGN